MNGHPVLWTSPAPLWGRFEGEAQTPTFAAPDQARPAILRFASDDFMERLLAMLESDPRRIGELVARPETWRTARGDTPDLRPRTPLPRMARALARLRGVAAPAASVAPTAAFEERPAPGGTAEMPLKLYQPAHERYYVVAANLVCAITGFPDRALATGGRDRVGFALRRLLPAGASAAAPLEEFAFIKDAAGARWRHVALEADAADPAGRIVDGEELLPLFPLHFRDDADHPRRMLAGLIPVGRREEYMTSRRTAEPSPASGAGGVANGLGTAKSARKEQFKMEVSEPWKNLVRTAHRALASMNEVAGTSDNAPSMTQKRDAAVAANQQLVAQSWLVLLDFADYLADHLPRVLERIEKGASGPVLDGAEKALFDWIESAGTGVSGTWTYPWIEFPSTLLDSLARIRGERRVLERAVRSYPDSPDELDDDLSWPAFHCLLAGIRERVLSSTSRSYEAVGLHLSLGSVPAAGQPEDTDEDLVERTVTTYAERLDKLVQLVVAALDAHAAAGHAPPIPFAARLRDALETTAADPGWFVMRCVYQRPDCGPLHPAVVSAPSQRFQLAGFFDPDAPARPIRIALPLDTTPAGMRKFDRNTAFILSDVLCGQVQRARELGFVDLVRAVLPWPLHKDLNVSELGPCRRTEAFGMICSLSIPIITVCALILLTIIVTLLDLIFKWLPWFVICFPVRGLAAKRA